MTLPNLITSLRIILTPIFVIYLIREDFPAALVIFIIAGLTDGADGLIARVFNQKSKLGSYLDPLADKILLIAAFVVLSVRDFIPPWLTVMAISRDILILLGVLILSLNQMHIIIRPSILSKVTTCLQLGTVFMVLSRDYLPQIYRFNTSLFWLTGLFTIASGLHYICFWFKVMGESVPEGQ